MVDADDDALFAEFRRSPRRSVRNQIVERHLGLAVHIARRFSPSAARDEDIQQVAMLALVKAVDRFDPTVGSAFSAFAGRTIEGEIKRHFRDKTWTVRVPRSAKELHLAVRRANDELTQTLGRSPSVAEVAEHLGVDRDDVVTGLSAAAARSVGSIDASPSDGEPAPDRRDSMADVESGFGHTDDAQVVQMLLDKLPAREREIVRLRFYEDLSQAEIAERCGMSQMHVSRLLRRSFEQMRNTLAD
ncbi:MAG: SigB/SigF/SigG family RNA polymerase sigma factor [Ilumatobacteraceae bacterium]